TRIDGAELACASADGAHDHDRRRAVRPAFADVRAHRLLADRREAMLSNGLLHGLVRRPGRQLRAQPRRLRRGLALAAVFARLDAVLDRGKSLGGAVLRTGDDHRDRAELVANAARLVAHGAQYLMFLRGVL